MIIPIYHNLEQPDPSLAIKRAGQQCITMAMHILMH